MTSRSALSAVFRVPTVVLTPASMLPHSFSSVTSSRARNVASGFYRSAHRIRGPPHACGSPPTRTRVWDGPAPFSCNAVSSHSSASTGVASSVAEGAGGMDAEASITVASAKDASDPSPSVHPAEDVTACMDDGPNRVACACDVAAAPDGAMSTAGALVVPSSVHLIADTTACTDDGTSCTISASGVAAVPSRAAPATSTPSALLYPLSRGRSHRRWNNPNWSRDHPGAAPVSSWCDTNQLLARPPTREGFL